MLRRSVLVVAVVLVSSGLVLAQNADSAWTGSWKLNVAKSKWSPSSGALKSQTSKATDTANGVMVVTDQVDAAGKAQHTEITYKFDGKEYELKGAPQANTTRIYSKIDAHTYQFVTRVGGTATTTSKVAIAADGKTRTITTTGKNANGETVSNVTAWDKQ